MKFKTEKIDYFFLAIMLFSLVIGIVIIQYGLPYSLHPDEIYLIKHPIKNIFNYAHLEFTSPMSLYGWGLTIWYGMVYCFGWLFHFWGNFGEFQNMIITEHGTITFFGRLYSVLLICVAHYFIYKLIRKITSDKLTKRISFLLFVLNPVLLSSAYWVKFEAAVYLSSCIMLNITYDYFVLNKGNYRKYIYIISIILLSVRIELVCFLFAILIFDYKKRKSIFLQDCFFKA